MNTDKSLKDTFDTIASFYHEARPSYPRGLYSDIQQYASITENSRLLEVGTGTGIATLPFAEVGCSIVCLDRGASLLEEAKRNLRKYPKLQFINQSFEDYTHTGSKFDLVFSATAFHWLDHEKAYPKISTILEPNGTLAIFWYIHVAHASNPKFDEFFFDVNPFYIEYLHASEADALLPPAGTIKSTIEETLAYGYFDDPQTKRYLFTVEYTADQYIALLNTYSGHIDLDERSRNQLFKGIRELIDGKYQGKITKQYLTLLDMVKLKG